MQAPAKLLLSALVLTGLCATGWALLGDDRTPLDEEAWATLDEEEGPAIAEASYDEGLEASKETGLQGPDEDSEELGEGRRIALEIQTGQIQPPTGKFAIEGRVVGPGKAPVKGAIVHAYVRPSWSLVQQYFRGPGRQGGTRSWRRIMQATEFGTAAKSKEDGSFRIEGQTWKDLHIEVTAEHANFAPCAISKAWKLSEGSLGVGDLSLDPGGTAIGEVVDEQGTPIQDAEVRYVSQIRDWTARRRMGKLIEAGKTDQAGKFRIAGLPEGYFRLQVVAKKYLSQSSKRLEIKGGNSVNAGTLKLVLGAEISGIVRGPEGQGISGAQVTASYQGPRPEDWRKMQKLPPKERKAAYQKLARMRGNGRPGKTQTDAEGRFSMDSLPIGDLRISVRHPKFIDANKDRVDPKQNPAVEIMMDRRVSLSGLVVDAVGMRPIENFGIRARKIRDLPQPTPPSKKSRKGRAPFSSRVRVNGRNRVIEFGANGRSRKGDPRNRKRETKRPSPRPRPRNGNRGRPRKPRGANRARTKGRSKKARTPRKKSPAQLRREQERERARQQKLAERQQRDFARKQRQNLQKARQENEKRYLKQRLGGSGMTARTVPGASAHPKGEFTLDDLQPGVYVLDVGAKGYVSQAAGPFEVASGKELEKVTVKLERGRFISGFVRDRKTGQGIPMASVELYLPRLNENRNPNAAVISPLIMATRGQNLGRRLQQVQTGSDGSFEFSCQKAGRLRLKASAKGYGSFVDESLMLSAGQDIRGYEARLGAGADLSGTVRGLEKGERATLIIASTKGHRRFVAVSAENNTYEAKGLEPGDYFVRLNRPGRRGGMMAQFIEAATKPGGDRPDVRLLEGMSRSFDVDAKRSNLGNIEGNALVNGVAGRGLSIKAVPLVDPLAGQKLAPQMRWLRSMMSSMGNTKTDKNGKFKLQNLPAGRYRLEVRRGRRGKVRLIHTQEVVVQGSAPARVTLQAMIGKLEVKILDAKTGKAVPSGAILLVSTSEAQGKSYKTWRKLTSFRQGGIRGGRVVFLDLPAGEYRYALLSRSHKLVEGQSYVASVGSKLELRPTPRAKPKKKGPKKKGGKKKAPKKPGAGKK